MPRRGTSARRRERQGLPPVKPGKVGWVHGSKLPFFEIYKDDFVAAAELKETGAFYDRISQLYLAKYGYNTGWDEDLEEDQDIADDVDPDEDVNKLSTEEGEKRAAYGKTLRAKIGVWYNGRYGGSIQTKGKQLTFKQLFDKPALEPPAPIKPRVLHYYSRKFYDERIKDKVARRWAQVSHLPVRPKKTVSNEVTAEEGLAETQTFRPAEIVVRNKVTADAWLAETKAFQDEMLAAIEIEHKAAEEAYALAVTGEVPSTPEGYTVALNNAGYYLQPFADAIHDRFGMNVSIMMCGPVPDRGGRIEVRSVHSGVSNGLVPRIWNDFDRGGFDAAQRSLIEFTRHCFTEAECRARSLNGMAMAQEDASTATTSTAPTATTSTAPAATASTAVTTSTAPAVTTTSPGSAARMEDPALDNQLLSFDEDLLRDPLREEYDPTLFDNLDFPPEMLDDWPRRRPGIGKALGRELARLPEEERAAQISILEGMTADGVENANDLARNRLLLERIDKGMSHRQAFAMDSDAEEDDAQFGEGSRVEGEAASATVTPLTTSTASSTTTTPLTTSSAAMTTTTATPLTTSTTSGVPRPIPRRLLQRPEVNRAAEGPLNDPGPPDAELQRPEANRAAEGPLGRAGEGAVVGAARAQFRLAMPTITPNAAAAAITTGSGGGGRDLEEKWGYPEKGMLSAPAGGEDQRPIEVPAFFRAARRWGVKVELTGLTGPRGREGSFARRWWTWWGRIQPPGRKIEGEAWVVPEELEGGDWEDISKTHGRNGMLIYLAGLLWWGEAAAAAEERSAELLADWRLAVDDVAGVLAEALKAGGPSPSLQKKSSKKQTPAAPLGVAAASTRSKRKTTDTTSGKEKENEAPNDVKSLKGAILLQRRRFSSSAVPAQPGL
ncbi:hypothetical protein B0H11DRAFT_2240370 [Mycena galericulata]|nr:hypothetical protein B0H11DRAFT_2240370 [Mycena galericulata]